MKRKITETEKNLIDKGFKLFLKKYYGSHSEKTLSYLYYGVIDTSFGRVGVSVVLDPKRNTVINYGIYKYYHAICGIETYTMKHLKEAEQILTEIKEFLFENNEKPTQNADEIVEIVEEINNVEK